MSANRILVISNYRSYHTVRPEAEIFIGLAKMGLDIHIMTYGDSKYCDHFKEAGITCIDFHPEKKFDKKEINFIRKYILENDIQVAHFFNGKAIVNGIQAAKSTNCKIALYRGYTGNIHWYDPSAYFKYLHPKVDAIFCNSIGIKEMLHRQLFFKKEKAVVINKGHNTDWYSHYEAYDIKKELGLSDNDFLIINVANNREMKGIPYLLEAMNELKEHKNIHLLLAGRDFDTNENKAIIKKGNQEKNIHFLGFRENVLNIVSACDAFVLSSLFGESITKSVIEAMSLSKPAVITDIPGNKELLEDGKSGFVVPVKSPKPMADAILKLANDISLCQEMGKNAKAYIEEKLNMEQTVIKTKALYDNLVTQ